MSKLPKWKYKKEGQNIPWQLRTYTFETDHWEAYKAIIPNEQHKVGKYLAD